MIPFKWTRPLWFFQPAANAETSAQICVSVAYNLTASVGEFDRDIELSALAFNLSANVTPGPENDGEVSIQANIDYDDVTYGVVVLQATITPVFVIDQTGQNDASISAAYNLTASVTASLFPDVVPVLAYNLSASLSAVLLIADNTDVTLAYNMTASVAVALQTQTGVITQSLSPGYGLSCSVNPQVAIVGGGGLVYSQKKGRYIPVNVGL